VLQGDYTLVAATFRQGHEGEFQVTIRAESHVAISSLPREDPAARPTPPQPPAPSTPAPPPADAPSAPPAVPKGGGLVELLGDIELLVGGGGGAGEGGKVRVADVKGAEIIGLYFSASWCGPCKAFTPQLAGTYLKLLPSAGVTGVLSNLVGSVTGRGSSTAPRFQVIFVSLDRDEEQFSEYFKEMPWLALPHDKRGLQQDLSSKFSVPGIPALVLLDGSSGALISTGGRAIVAADLDGSKFPWTA
jgi:nucleoredoxin